MVETFTIFFLAPSLFTVTALDGGGSFGAESGCLSQHVIYGLGPNLAEFVRILTTLTIAVDTERS